MPSDLLCATTKEAAMQGPLKAVRMAFTKSSSSCSKIVNTIMSLVYTYNLADPSILVFWILFSFSFFFLFFGGGMFVNSGPFNLPFLA